MSYRFLSLGKKCEKNKLWKILERGGGPQKRVAFQDHKFQGLSFLITIYGMYMSEIHINEM